MKLFFTVIQLLFWIPALGQIEVSAAYDSTCVSELYNRIPIGLYIKYEDGHTRKTKGFLKGEFPWNNIEVKTNNGTFQNGTLVINRKQLAEQQYTVKLSVIVGTSQPFQVPLKLPYLQNIRFNHYADSLKRDIHFYLNVEGVFSSGKIYPLDTSVIQFEVSEGKIIGQDLLIDLHSATRIITVTATDKNNPNIKVITSIPVKQLPDDMSLIKKK